MWMKRINVQLKCPFLYKKLQIAKPNIGQNHDYSTTVLFPKSDAVLTDLGIGHIETVLLAFSEKRRSLETLQASWLTLERLHKCFKVFSLGVADLNKTQLEGLYSWAEVGRMHVTFCRIFLSIYVMFAGLEKNQDCFE